MPKNKEEAEFQKGIKQTGWYKEYKKEYGEEPDLDIKEYDYRKAWKAGVRPERDPYDNNRYHWGSSDPKTGEMLKSKDHPTAWKEDYMRKTGKNPDEEGVTKEQVGMAKGGLGLGKKVGTPTGEFTKAGKPLFKTPDGENVSEKSVTLPYKDKWANVPSIQKGVRYDDDEIMDMLDKGRIKPTSTHDSIEEAVSAAESRSPALLDNEDRKIMGRKINNTKQQTKKLLNMAEGGMLQEGGSVDEVSGNKVPVGAMKEEVRDDIPAQLSEGEFVFPADVVRYIGLEKLMMMRQAAKAGLGKMYDMGQMSNGEDGTEEEDTAEFESEIDDIMGEMESEGKSEAAMAEGGMAQQTNAALAQSQQPSMEPTQQTSPTVPELTPEQMAGIQDTASKMQATKIDIPPEQVSQPTEGLTSADIIRNDTASGANPETVDKFLTKTSKLLKQNKAIILRQNDTVVVGYVKSPGVIDPRVFTQDDPTKLQDTTNALMSAIKSAGIKRLESDANPEINIAMYNSLGYPAKAEDPSTGIAWSLDLE